MTPRLSICMPYYCNPSMLAHQYSVWAGYDNGLKSQIQIVLVDDGSPAGQAAIDVPRLGNLPTFRIYRVLEDRPWHQHGARNLAANEAIGEWLFMTDMDHVLPSESLAKLLNRLTEDRVYGFHRVDAPKMQPKLLNGRHHPHQNTFAVKRERYWAAGGYDEDFCGMYGTDGYFLRKLLKGQDVAHLPDVSVIRFPREVIHDASTRAADGQDPKAFREASRQWDKRHHLLAMKAGHPNAPVPVLQFPWERVV